MLRFRLLATGPELVCRSRPELVPARPTPHAKRKMASGCFAKREDWHDLVVGERMIWARRKYLRGTMTKVDVACAEALAVAIIYRV